MAKFINVMDGFSLSDLTLKDGLIFETDNNCDNLDDEFEYSTDVPLSNEEALDLLNMDDFQDEDDCNDDNDDNNVTNSATICGINFENLKIKMTDIFRNGKVMKLIKQKGVGNVIPYDAQVTIKYIGHFEHRDEPFDSSFIRGGAETFSLNQGMLIPGLEIAIASMQKHEIAIFIIHPDLAYGKYGCPPRIPPNEEILFIVHLIDYVDNGSIDSFKLLSLEERKKLPNIINSIEAKFNTAKNFFNKQKIKQAIREYSKALYLLEEAELSNQEEEDKAKLLLSKGYNNLAVCYNMENKPRSVCNACNKVPIPTAKTYFNFGRALGRMGEYSNAMEKLQIALKMEPRNKDTIKEIKLINETQRKYLEIEKRFYGNCLKTERKGKEHLSSFEKVVYEMCEAFSQDNQILRLPLPECLTPIEDECVREQAAAFGLIVTTHQRYGREVSYLAKPNY